jgi:MFS family permease
MTITGRQLPRALRPLRHREFRCLVASLAASLFGSGSWLVAAVWQVMALGGGPAQLSLVATATSIGMVACVLIGGVAADRLPKRGLLRTVEVVRIGFAGLIGVLAVTGQLRLWQLVVVSFVLGTAESFYYPAYSALVPTLLPERELLAANGLDGVLRPVAEQALGPAAAGVLVAAFNPGAAFLGAALGYGVALLSLLSLGSHAVPPQTADESVFRQVGEGFRYLFRTGWLCATLLWASLYVLLVVGPIEVLLPFAVRALPGGGASGYALVLAGFGVGSVLGSVLVSSRRLPRRYLSVMLLGWGFGALPMVLLGWTRQLWVMAAATLVVGVTLGVGTVIWGTLLQQRVPAHMLGRVSSLDFFVSLALMPVSMAVAGPVGELLGLPFTFALAGCVPGVLAVLAMLIWRLRRDELACPLSG